MSRAVAFAPALVVLSLSRLASAQLLDWAPSYNPDDPYQLPDAPAPPTLPDLTHRAWALSVESTLASVKPVANDDGTRPPRAGVGIGRLEVEAAVANRRWYIGYAQEMAGGSSTTGDKVLFLSNPELWGRALWASRAGLAYGGGLGMVPPIVPQDPERDPTVRSMVRVVRPWDYPYFAGQVTAFRPFIDVRNIDGPITLQLRQGLDVLATISSATAIPDTTLTSRTTFYMGYRPMRELGVGLELWEVYFIKAPGVKDDERAVFAVSPSVRLMTPVLQPAISAIFPIDQPIFHSASSYWAVRLNLGVVLDPQPPKFP